MPHVGLYKLKRWIHLVNLLKEYKTIKTIQFRFNSAISYFYCLEI